MIQVRNIGTEKLSVGIQTVEQLFLEWEWSPEGRDWLAVQVHRQKSSSSWSGSGVQRGGTGWLFRYTGRIAALPGVEWSPEGRDWLAVQVHR